MRAAVVIAVAALVLLVAALLFQRDTARRPGPEPAPVAPAAEAELPTEPTPAPRPPAPQFPAGASVLESGATLAVDLDDLRGGGPLRVVLTLGDPAAGHAALSARIVTEGREQPLELAPAAPGGAAGYTLVAIDPAWLAPGRYIIEVKTNELSHMPLRRYALEVR